MYLYHYVFVHLNIAAQIVFEAIRGASWNGRIAVDDISFDKASTCTSMIAYYFCAGIFVFVLKVLTMYNAYYTDTWVHMKFKHLQK